MWVTAAVSNELLENRPHAICLIDAQQSCTCPRHHEMGCLLMLDLLFVGGKNREIYTQRTPMCPLQPSYTFDAT